MKTEKTLENITGIVALSYEIEFRLHAIQRMFHRKISHDDVLDVLKCGIVIEEYPTDFPFPSVLINGINTTGKPLHIVAAYDIVAHRIYIITAYDPDSQKWTNSFSERKLS